MHQKHITFKHVDPKYDDDGMRLDLKLMPNEINNDKSVFKRKKKKQTDSLMDLKCSDHLFTYTFIR